MDNQQKSTFSNNIVCSCCTKKIIQHEINGKKFIIFPSTSVQISKK